MKTCYILYNKNSGKAKKGDYIPYFTDVLRMYGYETTVLVSEYKEHVIKLMEELPNNIDLVISIGGDGTFNELVRGNYLRKHRLLLGHIPMGTTNDIGKMLGFGKNPKKNIKLLLDGVEKKMDICLINNNPFIYVAGFGNYTSIPYETNKKMKSVFGYLAYLFNALKDFFRRTKLHDISYEINGENHSGLFSFMLITNATRIGGIKIFDDIKLDDDQFEILFCNLSKRKHIIRSLYYLTRKDITHVPGFYFYKTNKLKIKINSNKKLSWCLDGEKYDIEDDIVNIKIDRNTSLLLPTTNIDKLFVNKNEEK